MSDLNPGDVISFIGDEENAWIVCHTQTVEKTNQYWQEQKDESGDEWSVLKVQEIVLRGAVLAVISAIHTNMPNFVIGDVWVPIWEETEKIQFAKKPYEDILVEENYSDCMKNREFKFLRAL